MPQPLAKSQGGIKCWKEKRVSFISMPLGASLALGEKGSLLVLHFFLCLKGQCIKLFFLMTRQVSGSSGGAREAGQLGEWRVNSTWWWGRGCHTVRGEGREGENTLVGCILAKHTHRHSPTPTTHSHTSILTHTGHRGRATTVYKADVLPRTTTDVL